MEPGNRELTAGELLVGLSFNPSGLEAVTEIKKAAANFLDVMGKYVQDGKLVTSIKDRATLDLLSAQMMAVKAATWDK